MEIDNTFSEDKADRYLSAILSYSQGRPDDWYELSGAFFVASYQLRLENGHSCEEVASDLEFFAQRIRIIYKTLEGMKKCKEDYEK
jgi:hypothetical protein